jgi:hypothetical protein
MAAQNVGAIAAFGVGGCIALAGLWAAPVSGVSRPQECEEVPMPIVGGLDMTGCGPLGPVQVTGWVFGCRRWARAVWRRPAPLVRTAAARARRDPARTTSFLARVTPV